MSGERSDNGSEANACRPCRGTGRLISGLGGEPHPVICPWCQGTGQRIAGLNPQDSPAEAGAPATQGSPREGTAQVTREPRAGEGAAASPE